MTLLSAATLDQLIAWSKEPKLFSTLTFGKHRGQKWPDIPADYLQWLSDGEHQMEAAWRHGAKVELQRRAKQL